VISYCAQTNAVAGGGNAGGAGAGAGAGAGGADGQAQHKPSDDIPVMDAQAVLNRVQALGGARYYQHLIITAAARHRL
jgi:hypothetical protein